MRSRNVGHWNLRSIQSLSLVLPYLVQREGAETEETVRVITMTEADQDGGEDEYDNESPELEDA